MGQYQELPYHLRSHLQGLPQGLPQSLLQGLPLQNPQRYRCLIQSLWCWSRNWLRHSWIAVAVKR